MKNGLKVFSNWFDRASVRRSPRRIVSPTSNNKFFSSNIAPILSHPLIAKLPDNIIRKIEVQFLYAYLQFTEYLETHLVNKAILSIINDDFTIKFDSILKIEGYKIYCDEAYHALQANDMLNQVTEITREYPLNLQIPLKSRLLNIENNFPRNLLEFFELFFVCVAETLVSQELREHMKDKSIHPAIQGIMGDHAKDEASHALFFKEVMIFLKKEQFDQDFKVFINHIPAFLKAYLIPDRTNIKTILSPYLKTNAIREVLNESLIPKKVANYVSKSSTMLNKTISEINKMQFS